MLGLSDSYVNLLQNLNENKGNFSTRAGIRRGHRMEILKPQMRIRKVGRAANWRVDKFSELRSQ